jgi:tetratricopeptide (TPR) repeat protein
VDQALKDYETALKSFPNYAPALINHGALETNAGKFNLALADYDKALLADPANSTALGSRCGVRLALKKDPNEALADCNEALRLEPANVWAHMMRREAYTRLGRCTEAAADFDAAVKIDPSQAKAPADFDVAIRIDPSQAKAPADFNAAVKIDPSQAKVPSEASACQAAQAARK